ncbi:hypothetical protein D3C86_1222830 [compost metagenome]
MTSLPNAEDSASYRPQTKPAQPRARASTEAAAVKLATAAAPVLALVARMLIAPEEAKVRAAWICKAAELRTDEAVRVLTDRSAALNR